MLKNDPPSSEKERPLNPRANYKSGRFWDKIAHKYSQQPIKDIEAYAFKLEKTQSYFPLKAVVLEFGCGTGMTALYHAAKVEQVLAIDTSPNMIQIARERLQQLGLDNVTFEVASIEDVAHADNAFDVILGMSVLHLLPNPEVVLFKIRKLLKPDGVFISSTHCVGDKSPWIRRLVPLGQFLKIMPFVKLFTKSDLKKWLSNAGFSVEFEWAAVKSPSTLFLISKIKGDQSSLILGEKDGHQNA